MLGRFPSAIRTLFADLVQQVETAPQAGTPYNRKIEGIDYLYAKVPVGFGRIDQFLGRADDADAQVKADIMRRGMTLARSRRSIVSMLSRAGVAGPDRILGSTLDAIAHAGLFRSGAVVVGTAAYMQSEMLIGQRMPEPTLMTGDLDIAAAKLTLAADPPQSMRDILRRADPSFDGILQLDPRRPSSRFRNDEGYLVELLTPISTREDPNPLALPALDAGAIPIQYMAWLIADAVSTVALWGSGIPIKVPQPARYAVHKLIIAQRRDPSNRIKRSKDLAQAKSIIEALEGEDPFAIEDALTDARGQGQAGWGDPIARSLREIGLDL